MLRLVKSKGLRWQSTHGWFYLGIKGPIYSFHIEIGRFGITVMRRNVKWRDRD